MFDSIHIWGPFVLNVNPILVEIGGLKFWYYGLAYALGFLSVFVWIMMRRARIGLHANEVWSLSIFFATLSLIGGRIYELTVNEWSIFRANPFEAFKFWHGGIASQGVLLGAMVGIAMFCLIYKRNFLRITDDLVIPAVLLLLLIGVGNHISGEAYGSPTTFWWGVKFPYAEEFRHPIAVYEVVRNLFLILVLALVRTRAFPTPGKLVSNFIFWYGLSNIPVDYFRVHGAGTFGIDTMYYYDVLIAAIGLLFIVRTARKRSNKRFDINTLRFAPAAILSAIPSYMCTPNFGKAIIFILLLLFALIMPGSWSNELLKQMTDTSGV